LPDFYAKLSDHFPDRSFGGALMQRVKRQTQHFPSPGRADCKKQRYRRPSSPGVSAAALPIVRFFSPVEFVTRVAD